MKPNPTPNNAAIIGMAGSNRSNLSLHRFLPESVTQNLLTILSLLHTSGISTTLLLGLFDAESLSTAVSTLISQSYVQQDLAKRSVSIDPLAQQTVLSEIMASSDRSRYFALATRSLNSIFNAEFARPRTLHRSHRLYLHVSTILNTTMDLPLDLSAFEEATTLAIRYCMYLITVGHYSQALKLIAAFREWCKAQLPSDFDVETALSGKEAAAQASSGSLNTALCLLRYIYRSRLRTFGPTDIDTLHSINGLGLVHHALGNVQKAFRYHSKALVAKTRFLGANDPDTLVSANNLGLVLQSKGDYQAAEKLFSRTLKGWLQAYDPDDLFVITARSNIGIALHFQGKLDEAENIHRYVYNERLRILGNTHHETVKSKANLAITVNEKGYPSQAEQLYREALAAFQTELGQSHPDTLKTHTNLATALHDQGKFQEAESVVKLALPLIGAKYGSSHAETIEAMAFRAILLQHLGKFTKAHGIATEVYEARREKLGYDHDDTQRSLQHVRDLAEDCEEAHVLQTFSTSISIAAA
jgi:tetratricopeptide (TPR) repeat protein